MRAVDGIFCLDGIASGNAWVDMGALGVDACVGMGLCFGMAAGARARAGGVGGEGKGRGGDTDQPLPTFAFLASRFSLPWRYLTAPQKGWAGPACCGIVMLSEVCVPQPTLPNCSHPQLYGLRWAPLPLEPLSNRRRPERTRKSGTRETLSNHRRPERTRKSGTLLRRRVAAITALSTPPHVSLSLSLSPRSARTSGCAPGRARRRSRSTCVG